MNRTEQNTTKRNRTEKKKKNKKKTIQGLNGKTVEALIFSGFFFPIV